MPETLFDAIVEALLARCAATGLKYSEINILIYCGFLPATWFGIVYLRQRRWLWWLAVHVIVPTVYYVERAAWTEWSGKFYTANIQALEQLGKTTGWGYVGISLVVGIVVPGLIYIVLCSITKRWLLLGYTLFLAGNLAWYFWAGRA